MPSEENSIDIVLQGSVGFYRRLDLESIWGDDGSLIAFGSDVSSMGFCLVGDLMCSAFADVLVRAFAHPTRGTYALLLTGMRNGRLHVFSVDFWSSFADGTSLTTSTTPSVKDIPSKGIYKKVYPWGGAHDLFHKHQKHLDELIVEHGQVKPVDMNLRSLAELLDSFFVRQHG